MKTLKTSQIRREIKKNIKEKYEQSRDSIVGYVLELRIKYQELLRNLSHAKNEFEKFKREIFRKYKNNAVISPYIPEHNEFCLKNKNMRLAEQAIHGKYNPKTRKNEGGFKQSIKKEYFKVLCESNSEAKIKAHYKKIFVKIIEDVVDSIIKEIEKFSPTKITKGESDHDFNYVLTINDIERSYTINTIIAGGNVQCIHYRVLKKLHKGIAK